MLVFFFFKQKTAYEMRISDWSSDVCSSDLQDRVVELDADRGEPAVHHRRPVRAQAPEHQADPLQAGSAGRRAGEAYRGSLPGGPEGCRREIGRASCRERVCQYV